MNQNSLPYARSYRDLVVYQRQQLLAQRIFEITKSFPREEMYSLTDQVRRAARSIGAQIAEAWAKRDYERHFLSKLTDADAEQNETQHWIETARSCTYLSTEKAAELLGLCDEIGRMLRSMKSHSSDFCTQDSPRLREAPEFFAEALSTKH